MKDLVIRGSLLATILLVMASCAKQPRACFDAPELVEVGEPVEFTNCSSKAFSYLWQFDDGTESEEAQPTHVYTKRGKYKVYLTAYSKNGLRQTKANHIIEVANRYLEQFTLKSVPFGTAWDASDGPDLKLIYGPVDSVPHVTVEVPNADAGDLPIIWMSNTDVMFTDEDWSFTLVDVDPSADDTIAYWVINPTDQNKPSPINLNASTPGNTSLDIEYEIR